MKFFKPFKLKFNVIDALVAVSALDYLIADNDRLWVDRAAAELLRQRIVNSAEENGMEVTANKCASDIGCKVINYEEAMERIKSYENDCSITASTECRACNDRFFEAIRDIIKEACE